MFTILSDMQAERHLHAKRKEELLPARCRHHFSKLSRSRCKKALKRRVRRQQLASE
jgi:hypothetical protein